MTNEERWAVEREEWREDVRRAEGERDEARIERDAAATELRISRSRVEALEGQVKMADHIIDAARPSSPAGLALVLGMYDAVRDAYRKVSAADAETAPSGTSTAGGVAELAAARRLEAAVRGGVVEVLDAYARRQRRKKLSETDPAEVDAMREAVVEALEALEESRT